MYFSRAAKNESSYGKINAQDGLRHLKVDPVLKLIFVYKKYTHLQLAGPIKLGNRKTTVRLNL